MSVVSDVVTSPRAVEIMSLDRPLRHLYVHVPFCARRCSYCDFAIAVRRTVPVADFVRGVLTELQARLPHAPTTALTSVYLGGGTPSRLGGDGIQHLLETIRSVVVVDPTAEITMEANPEDISAEAVAAWCDAGVNRLSIGAQSFDDRVLHWMHRVHDAAAITQAVQVARAGGITDISLDLIFSVPDALQRDWAADLSAVLALEPTHISLYGLTIEPQTPLGRWTARGEVLPGGDESYESEFLLAHERLGAAGFEHYEVSNFARPGHRAVHNSAYWRGVPYLGVGPSAHGFDGAVRRWNTEAYAAWQQTVDAGRDPLGGDEQLTPENRVAETVYLGLRTLDGLLIHPSERATVQPWIDAGWIELAEAPATADQDVRVRCTPLGWLRLDRLAADLTALRSYW
ncbi:MAG: radical SAM family heme chaperone HemW [Gemmatimonadaceae bacterium]